MDNTRQQILRLLSGSGATYPELADSLDISESATRNHVSNLRREGHAIGFDVNDDGRKQFFLNGEAKEHPTNETQIFTEETRKKQSKSKQLTAHMTDMEARLADLLDNSQPAMADGQPPLHDAREDVVIHRTDAHFGDHLTDEFGNTVYSPEIAREREQQVTDKAMDVVERQQRAGVEFDTANLLLGGDHVTGEHIYANQLAEVTQTLDEQVDMAFEVYMEQIQRLAAAFPALQVVCQQGNHGALEAKYSNGANADKLLFMMLDKAVRQSSLDNVTFIRNDSTTFTNVSVRGWDFHLRHGQNSLEHIGTSAGKKRWYNWLLNHGFDQAYRGHYHQHEIDSLHGDVEVIMTGSPKPPDDFEESIAEWSAPTATIHGVSDSQTRTWTFPVSFDN